MKIDTANSGDEGITAALGNIYDIIFLDHMMPNKDGIQTLKEMKSMENNPNLDTVTANAISGAREQYISEGFDDYMTKPIDPVKLEELLMRYLPESKIIYTPDEDDDTDSYSDNDIPDFLYDDPEINVETGIRNCGDKQSYMETLATFADTIDDSIEKVREYYDCEDIKNATVKIHAFKSISKIIGAADLGELAQQLENAGNADDTEFMAANIGEFLDRCRELSDRLAPLRVKQEEQEDLSLPFINDDEYSEICSAIKDYAADLDSLGIISAIEDMKKYRLTDEQKDKMQRVLKAADDFEYEDIPDIIDE